MATTKQQLDGAAATIVISGRFDAHQVPQVQQEIDNLQAAGARFIILDLSDVNFVDSSALAVMVRGMKRCRERNGELLLCGLRQPQSTSFDIAPCPQAFRIYDSEEAAQRSLAAG